MNKKICFICLGNLFLTPYINKYIKSIECDYDIIFWNRYGINELSNAKKQYSYNFSVAENSSKLKKLHGYISFANYARKIIIENKYDGIILTPTNIGMILSSTLRKYYKGKYIIDIRDYTMEKNILYYKLEKILLDHAAYNVISSEGYKQFLPKGNYIVVHNKSEVPIETINTFRFREKKNKKLILTNIGLIRFHDQNKKIIDIFSNDNRFEIRFIGADALSLKDYCNQKKAENIVLLDRFPPENTFDLLKNTDIILNLYGNNTPVLDYALSNKLYFASQLGLPILVCPNTFMERLSKEYGFGFSFELEDIESKDKLLNWYKLIDWKEFYEGCNRFLNKVKKEDEIFDEIIKKFVIQI